MPKYEPKKKNEPGIKNTRRQKNHIKEEKSTNYSGIIVYFIFYKPLFYQQFEIIKKMAKIFNSQDIKPKPKKHSVKRTVLSILFNFFVFLTRNPYMVTSLQMLGYKIICI